MVAVTILQNTLLGTLVSLEKSTLVVYLLIQKISLFKSM